MQIKCKFGLGRRIQFLFLLFSKGVLGHNMYCGRNFNRGMCPCSFFHEAGDCGRLMNLSLVVLGLFKYLLYECITRTYSNKVLIGPERQKGG